MFPFPIFLGKCIQSLNSGSVFDCFCLLINSGYPYPLNPQNQGGTSENVSYIFGRAPGTPKNVSWNPPRCPEWSVFEGGGGAPKNVSWNLEGHKLHFCHPPPLSRNVSIKVPNSQKEGGGEYSEWLDPPGKCNFSLRRCLRD